MSAPKQESFCRSCGAPIVFLKTASGKWMPVNAETITPGDEQFEPRSGHVSHFSDCSAADQWRRDAKGG